MMKNIRAAAVQFNHHAGDKKGNLQIIKEFVELAAHKNVDLIIFPEMCITGYWHIRKLDRPKIEALAEEIPAGPSVQFLLKLSQSFNMIIGAGLIEISPEKDFYNSYVVAIPDGNFACHRKLHVFVSEHIKSGDTYTVFDTPLGCRLGILTCWDNNLVENARITALRGAEILISPHQTGGCDSRSPRAMGLIDPQLWHNRFKNPDAIKAEIMGPKGRGWIVRWLPSRAHDNGMFLIFSNGIGLDDNEVRTGNAMILDPYGEILVESQKADDDMVVANLRAKELPMCTGQRWLKARRPDMYGDLIRVTGKEKDIRLVRFSD
jgi:predicted amidohydrolase